jgi:hypothetical protein
MNRLTVVVAAIALLAGFFAGHLNAARNYETHYQDGYEQGCQVAADNNQENDEAFAICIEAERG